mmetsp:Transcript_75918/g.173816  ORF Transcript_75918/g.173816 Transcript_75918/m.173816 type:complete len:211 (-) Transcript_75918:204-836(-)
MSNFRSATRIRCDVRKSRSSCCSGSPSKGSNTVGSPAASFSSRRRYGMYPGLLRVSPNTSRGTNSGTSSDTGDASPPPLLDEGVSAISPNDGSSIVWDSCLSTCARDDNTSAEINFLLGLTMDTPSGLRPVLPALAALSVDRNRLAVFRSLRPFAARASAIPLMSWWSPETALEISSPSWVAAAPTARQASAVTPTRSPSSSSWRARAMV